MAESVMEPRVVRLRLEVDGVRYGVAVAVPDHQIGQAMLCQEVGRMARDTLVQHFKKLDEVSASYDAASGVE